MSRALVDNWPVIVNGTTPDSGTKLTREVFDAMRDAIEGVVYHPDREETPAAVIDEVAVARDVYASLSARLAAMEALISGGGGGGTVPGVVSSNWLTNGDLLLWSGGDAALPDNWQIAYSGAGAATIARVAHDTYPSVVGKNALKVSTASGGYTDLIVEAVAGTVQGTDGRAALKNAKMGAGVWINAMSGYANKVEVYVQDTNSNLQLVGKQGATTSAGATPDAAGWVWSAAVDEALTGGCDLSSSADRLRLVIRITGAAVVYLQGATLGPGISCPWSVPCLYELSTIGAGYSPDVPLSTGAKASWKLDSPCYIVEGHGLATVSGTAVVTFAGATFTFTASTAASVSLPSGRSLAKDTTVTYNVSSTDTSIRSPLVALRVLKPLRPIRGLFGTSGL